MKTRILISAIVIGGFILHQGCSKDTADTLSKGDLSAYQGLQSAYSNAKAYNDSLIITSDSLLRCYYDSMYDYHEILFEQHHHMYSHDNSFDDHHHDNMGMMQMHNGNGMHQHGECCGSTGDGHHAEDHDAIDRLYAEHQPYHIKH